MTRIATAAATIVLLLVSWFLLSVGLMYFADASATARVYLQDRAVLSNLPDGIDIVSAEARSAVLTSTRPGYVQILYRKGALLVLPVRRQSCLTLSGDQSAVGNRRIVNSIRSSGS